MMKTPFFKRQSTWVCILLAGLVVIAVCIFRSNPNLKSEIYSSLLKFGTTTDATIQTDYNLGFEIVSNPARLPDGWFKWGYPSYDIKIDSIVKHSGRYALRIEAKNKAIGSEFGCPTRSIPAIYAGETITVKAFMKTEDVDQPIGLLLRIDGKTDEVLQFDNMQQRGITGSGNWEEYSVSLPLPEAAKTIFVGTIFSGKGKLWVDDFEILIDGKYLAEAKIKEPRKYKADEDTGFDSGSFLSIKTYNTQTVSNLELLGKIWGFLKYYHPAIAAGEYNWDAELFRVMPLVIEAKNNEERNQIFVQWIDRLGKIKPAKGKNKGEAEIKLYPDLDWIENPDLGKTLSQRLKTVKDAKRSMDNYYIEFIPGVLNPIFKNEKSYANMSYYDDRGLRLLALFRYWNMIQYFSPYRYLTTMDWNTALGDFIPKFLDGFTEKDYILTLMQLSDLVDERANFWNETAEKAWRGSNFAPYVISFIEEKVVVVDYMNTELVKPSELKKGDIIVRIDKHPVEEIVEAKHLYPPVYDMPIMFPIGGYKFLMAHTEKLSFQIIRDGKSLTREITCHPLNSINSRYQPKASHRLLSSDVGYIYPRTLRNDSLSVMMETFKDTKGIVIDFRGYQSLDDSLMHRLAACLMPHPVEFAKFANGNLIQPGKFTFGKTHKVGNNNPQCYKGKVVIIVNETTQSSAEYHTMAFQTAPEIGRASCRERV